MRATPTLTPHRFESDREALPFPVGGVFAARGTARDGYANSGPHAPDITKQVLDHMAMVQRRMDELTKAIDEPIPFRAPASVGNGNGGNDRWPPAA